MGGTQSEPNEIRRFELLRNELIELEKRVQRSTGGTPNEEVCLELVVMTNLLFTLLQLALLTQSLAL